MNKQQDNYLYEKRKKKTKLNNQDFIIVGVKSMIHA